METVIQVACTVVITIATVILVWLTSKYVRLTKHIVEEMKTSKEPYVYVDFELPENLLRLTVGNSGQTPARNVRFTVHEDVSWLKFKKIVLGGTNLPPPGGVSSLPPIRSGISYLSPGRKLRWIAGSFALPKEDGQQLVRMTISYENEQGKSFTKETAIDLSQYKNVLYETFRDPEQQVAEAIKNSARKDRNKAEWDKKFDQMWRKTTCPMCAKIIPSAAKKCSHCGELMTVLPPEQEAIDPNTSRE